MQLFQERTITTPTFDEIRQQTQSRTILQPRIIGGDWRVGAGTSQLGVDANGMRFGAEVFASAPFRVEPDGTAYYGLGNNIISLTPNGTTYRLAIGHATPASAPFSVTKTGSMKATLGEIAGWVVGATTLTADNVTIDSGNKRILINDGSDDRVLIGYDENGF